jgi:y4mF family transcriptional regulator
MTNLSTFVSEKRKSLGLTQIIFAKKAGVALTVIRKIEQGKQDLQLSKVNQVLAMFGHSLCPVPSKLIIE